MSAPFKPYDPDQSLLLPPNLREWLPEGHVALFVMDVVKVLDLGEILRYYEIAPVLNDEGEVIGQRAKTKRGKPAYDPRMMTALLLYGYVTGVPSSRQIERKCQEDVGFRVISANQKPDHSTIAEFRRIHLVALGELFLDVLKLCRKAGLVKLGHVSFDGTKVKANASKHKAMSYAYMEKDEKRLKEEIRELLREAEDRDRQEDRKYGKGKRGDELPEKLARRESRLKVIQEAKKALEEEAREKAKAEGKLDEDGKPKPPKRGKPPKTPPGTPKPKAQRNFTDSESRIMKNADKAFIQGYNAQAGVDREHQVIVARDVTNQAADAPHLKPLLEQTRKNMSRKPKQVSLDAGYCSEENLEYLERKKIDAYVATERLKHNEKPPAPRGPIPKDATRTDRMRRKLRTVAGKAIYALRKITVEPVFGQIRTCGLVRFWLRGLAKVKAEWSLWCTAHNLLKLFRSGAFSSA